MLKRIREQVKQRWVVRSTAASPLGTGNHGGVGVHPAIGETSASSAFVQLARDAIILFRMQHQDPRTSLPTGGEDGMEFQALERIAIRMRESRVTTSAWCLALRTRAGEGRIVRIECADRSALFRGEGVFLGWPQTDLEALYRRSLPPAPPSEPDAGQLG
jgi:hypothetical protein